MGTHAKYSASKISRIIRCPGSEDFVQYLIQKKEIPEEESTKEASEGSWLHDQQEKDTIGKPLSKELDAEQLECIEANRDWLADLQAEHHITWLQTERKIDLSGYGIEDAGGTADIIMGSEKRSLHILDWKFGKGVPVYVEKNEQLMDYLCGAAGNLEALESYDELWIHLGQPRFDYFASYQCNVNELMGLVNAIKNAVKSYDIVAGDKQCFWCRGKVRCVEYEERVRGNAAVVFKAHDVMKNNQVDFKTMAKLLEIEPLFKQVFKAVKDAYAEMSTGQLKEHGFKRVAGRSTRSYVSDDQVVEYLCKNYGDVEDIYTEPKLKSPAQIEKSIKGIKKDPEFQKLIYKPVGKPTIVSLDDKRPEYDSGAGSAFAHLVKEE